MRIYANRKLYIRSAHGSDDLAGSGANGAIIHYKPEPDTCSVVDSKKLFLLDSGAQYVDGTTDITRTVHFGEPTKREKECFTRVLQVLPSFHSFLLVGCVTPSSHFETLRCMVYNPR